MPIAATFVFGGDEHYELIKAFLYYKGFHLYTQIWDDQAPLFTILESVLFKFSGPSVFAGRLLVLGFATALIVAFCSVVQRTSGYVGAAFGVLCLVSSPGFLFLSVSVMQEIPTIAAGLTAVAFLLRWENRGQMACLFLSGIFMGCALQIKLTAALMIPAAMAVILFRNASMVNWKSLYFNLSSAGVWFLGMLISFSVIFVFVGGVTVNVHTLMITHFAGTTANSKFGGPRNFPFNFSLFREHIEVVTGALFGMLIIFWREQSMRMRFPIIYLFTSLCVFIRHRPFLDFYYLHISVPMVWIVGHVISETLQRGSIVAHQNRVIARLKRLVLPVAGLSLCSLLTFKGIARLEKEIQVIRQGNSVSQNQVLRKIMQYRNGTHWLYTSSGLYAVYSELPVPPEIAVVTLKRLWTGQITEQEIARCVEKYQPDQALLSSDLDLFSYSRQFFESNYVRVYDDGTHALYVAKTLCRDRQIKATSSIGGTK